MRAGAAEVDLHAPHHPDDLLAMLAVGQLGVVHAGEPQIVRAAALEEFEIAGVVDDAGKIGVGVVDPRHQPVADRRQLAGKPGRSAPPIHHDRPSRFPFWARLAGNRSS